MGTRASVGVLGLTWLGTSDEPLGREPRKHSNDLESFHRSLYTLSSCKICWADLLDLEECDPHMLVAQVA